MLRRPWIAFTALALLVASSAARAQTSATPTGAPLPVATDLKTVPVGSWSQYRVSDGGQTNVNVRIALVARAGQEAQVETQVTGGPMGPTGKTTMRMTVPTDTKAGASPHGHVIQVGDNDPMELPAQMAAASQPFTKPDPKKKVGSETVTVPAGTFKVDHYRDKAVDGRGAVDFWIAANVLPFGMVKMVSAGNATGGTVTMELTAKGADAKPTVTKPPKPFDPQAMMRQMQPLAGGTAGAPPAAAPPASAKTGSPAAANPSAGGAPTTPKVQEKAPPSSAPANNKK